MAADENGMEERGRDQPVRVAVGPNLHGQTEAQCAEAWVLDRHGAVCQKVMARY